MSVLRFCARKTIGTKGQTKLASKAEWYTLCDFAPQNCLLVDGPQSPGTAPYRSWLRVSTKRFITGLWPRKLHRPTALSRFRTADAGRGGHMAACVWRLFFLPIPTHLKWHYGGKWIKNTAPPATMPEKP